MSLVTTSCDCVFFSGRFIFLLDLERSEMLVGRPHAENVLELSSSTSQLVTSAEFFFSIYEFRHKTIFFVSSSVVGRLISRVREL